MVLRIGLILLGVILLLLGIGIVLIGTQGQQIAAITGMAIAQMLLSIGNAIGTYRLPVGFGLMAGSLSLIAANLSLMILRLRERRAPYMVETPYLVAMVNPVTGEVDGEIRRGQFAGTRVRMMPLFYLRKLLAEMASTDPEGVRVIESMLDHFEPGWRDSDPSSDLKKKIDISGMFDDKPGAAGAKADSGKSTETAVMPREQALAILGLSGTPGPEEIKVAYRGLMMKIHPDQGGSSYLAAQLNEAKNVLLR